MNTQAPNRTQINDRSKIVAPPTNATTSTTGLATPPPISSKPSLENTGRSTIKLIADKVSKDLIEGGETEVKTFDKPSDSFRPVPSRQDDRETLLQNTLQLSMQTMMQQFSTVCQQLVSSLDKKPSPAPVVSSSNASTNTNVYNIQPSLAPVTFTKRKRSEMTTEEIENEERVSKKLKETIPQHEIKERPGPGGQKLLYASAFTVIDHANQVFGHDGWSYRILNYVLDKPSQNSKTGSITVFARVMVEVTLASSGAISQEVGCGKGIDKDLFEAQTTAIKSGTSDALKRCLRRFGNFTGNCLYDKDFLEGENKENV